MSCFIFKETHEILKIEDTIHTKRNLIVSTRSFLQQKF